MTPEQEIELWNLIHRWRHEANTAKDVVAYVNELIEKGRNEGGMTKAELLKALRENNGATGDREGQHEICDEALLVYINDAEITDAFFDDDGTKWYA